MQRSERIARQAHDWLRATLNGWVKYLEMTPDKMAPVVAQQMQNWLSDPDFNGVRGAEALAKLPEAGRTRRLAETLGRCRSAPQACRARP